MIFPTTFIVTLFLVHIARARPQACHNPITHESPSTLDEQYNLAGQGPIIPIYEAFYNPVYDHGDKTLAITACASLGPNKKFKDFSHFPDIGAAPDNAAPDKQHCGALWKLTNIANNKTVQFTSIDKSTAGFVLSDETYYNKLGGTPAGHIDVNAEFLHAFC